MATNEVSILAVLRDKFSKPLAKMGTGFDRVIVKVRKLNQSLAPLSGRFASLATSIISVQGARKSLEAAEEQVQAEQAVLSALEGQVLAQERLLKISSEIQEDTTTGDEELLKQEAILLRMGVAAERIPDAIRVSVDTAAGLGQSLQLVVRSVGRALTTGDAGLLGSRVKVLKELQKEGTLTTKVIAALDEAFGGAAAALAETDFGKKTQELNTFGDGLEKIGSILIRFVVPALIVVNSSLDSVIEFTESNAAQIFFALFERAVPFFVQAVIFLGSLSAGLLTLKAIAFTFGGLFTVLGSLSGLVFSLVTALSGIPILILAILAGFQRTDGLLTSISSKIGDLIDGLKGAAASGLSIGSNLATAFKQIRNGEKDAEKFSAIVNEAVRSFGDLLDAHVLNRISKIGSAILNAGVGLFENLRFNLEALGQIAIRIAAKVWTKIFQTIAKDFDKSTDDTKRKLAKLLGIPLPLLAAGARAASTAEFKIIDDKVEDLISKGEAGADRLNSAFKNVFEGIDARIKEAERNFERSSNALEAFVLNSDPEFLKNQIISQRIDQGEISRAIRALTSDVADLDSELAKTQLTSSTLFDDLDTEKIKELLTTFDSATSEILKTVLSTHIEEQFKNEIISVTEYLNSKAALETSEIDAKLEGLRSVIEARQAELEVLKQQQILDQESTRTARARLDATLSSGASLSNIGIQVVEVTKALREEEDTQFRIRDVSKELLGIQESANEVIAERILLEQELATGRENLGTDILAKAQEARAELAKSRDEISNQVDLGLPFTDALALEQAAIDKFTATLEQLKASLAEVALLSPEAAEGLAEVEAKLLDIGDSVESTSASSKTFFGSMRDGAQATADDLGDLEKQAANIGATLTQVFARDLVRAINDSDFSWKAFAGNFLLLLSRMVQELLVFKAISASLKFFGGGSGFLEDFHNVRAPIEFRHDGGPIPGPNIDADVIPAMLTPGEHVINKVSTGILSHGFLGFLNSIRSKADLSKAGGLGGVLSSFAGGAASVGRAHFATGGGVSSTPSPFLEGQATGINMTSAVLTGSYQTMEQLLSGGGENALFDLLGRNRDLTRAAAGLDPA